MKQPSEPNLPVTEAEIERERKKFIAGQISDHLKFARRFTFHKSSTFMDYLHGDASAEEADLACLYEYARELPAVWEAGKRRDKLLAAGVETEKAASWACQENDLTGQTTFPLELLNFLACSSFPKKDWQELTLAERKKIKRFDRKKISPLPMTDVYALASMGVFEKFKAMARDAEPVVEDHDPQRGKIARPYQPVPPVLQKWDSVYHAVFDLDFSKSETQLAKEFLEWLRLPDNQKWLATHKKPSTGTTGKTLDRLKDLAAWRLFREFGNDWNKANDFASQKTSNRAATNHSATPKDKPEASPTNPSFSGRRPTPAKHKPAHGITWRRSCPNRLHRPASTCLPYLPGLKNCHKGQGVDRGQKELFFHSMGTK